MGDHLLELRTCVKGVGIDLGDLMGDDDLLQHGAGLECIAGNGGQAGAEGDILQGAAAAEDGVADLLDGIGHDNSLQGGTAVECIATDVGNAVGDLHSLQGLTILEHAAADCLQLFVDLDAGQAGAAIEAAEVGCSQILGQFQSGQGLAVLESVPLKGLQACGQLQGCQSLTAGEAAVADEGNGVGDLDALQRLAVGERAVADPGQAVGQVDLLQSGTTGESSIFNFGNSIAHGHVLQIDATGKCTFANGRHGLGDHDLLNAVAVVQHGIGDLLHAFFQNDFLQLVAIMEGAVTAFFHALGNGHGGQGLAVLKCVPVNGLQACGQLQGFQNLTAGEAAVADEGNGVGDLDALQRLAVGERAVADPGQAVGQVDLLQSGTTGESSIFNFGNSIAHGHVLQIDATGKCTFANGRHGLGDHDLFNAVAVVQHGVGDLLHALFQNDFLQLVAVMEGAVTAFLHALGNGHGGQGLAVFESVPVNGLQAFRQLQGCQSLTAGEAAVADEGNGVGDLDALQRLAVGERAVADPGQAVGQVDLLQSGTTGESSIFNFGNSIAHGHVLQIDTACKGAFANGGHRLGDHDLFNAVAVVQHGIGDLLHALFQNDFLQLGTVIEGPVTGFLQALGNGDGRQGLAVLEGIPVNGLQARRQLDADQRSTVGKGVGANRFNRIRKLQNSQRLTAVKGAIGDLGQTLGQLEIIQIQAVVERKIANGLDGIGDMDADEVLVAAKGTIADTHHIIAVQGLGDIEAAGVAVVLGDDGIVVIVQFILVEHIGGVAAAAGTGAVDPAAQIELVPAADPVDQIHVAVAALQTLDAVLVVLMDLGRVALLEDVIMSALGITPEDQVHVGVGIDLRIGIGHDIQTVAIVALDLLDLTLGAEFQIGMGLDKVRLEFGLQLDADLHVQFGDHLELLSLEGGQAAHAAPVRELHACDKAALHRHGAAAVQTEDCINTGFADAVIHNADGDGVIDLGKLQQVCFRRNGQLGLAVQPEHGILLRQRRDLVLQLHVGKGQVAADLDLAEVGLDLQNDVVDLFTADLGKGPAFGLRAVFKDVDGLDALGGDEVSQIDLRLTLDIHGHDNIVQGDISDGDDGEVALDLDGLGLIGAGHFQHVDHKNIASGQFHRAALNGQLIVGGEEHLIRIVDVLDAVDVGVAVHMILVQRRLAQDLGNRLQNGSHFSPGHSLLGQELAAGQGKPSLIDRHLNVIRVGHVCRLRVCIGHILRQLEHQRRIEGVCHKFAGRGAMGHKGQAGFGVDQTKFNRNDDVTVKFVFGRHIREIIIRTCLLVNFHGAGIHQGLDPLRTGYFCFCRQGLYRDHTQTEHQDQKHGDCTFEHTLHSFSYYFPCSVYHRYDDFVNAQLTKTKIPRPGPGDRAILISCAAHQNVVQQIGVPDKDRQDFPSPFCVVYLDLMLTTPE